MKRKLFAGLLAFFVAAAVMLPVQVKADGQRVVTLGANLSEEQEKSILRYFGINDLSKVEVIYITNQDERDHLASYIPLEQIGTRTLSCAYVSPTNSGGIRVKTANLNYVTSNMFASTLSTLGIVNCDVIAAAPFPISGTGALTGVIMAYEEASGEKLAQSRKELATQELITTGTLADEIGQLQATEVVNDIKIQIIGNQVEDEEMIDMIVDEVVDRLNERSFSEEEEMMVVEEEDVELLDDEDREMLKDLARQIAGQKYDYEEMRDTLERVDGNIRSQTGGDTIINNDISIVNNNTVVTDNSDNSIMVIDISTPEDDEEEMVFEEEDPDSILNFTDDSALGEGVVSDSTNREDNLPQDLEEEEKMEVDGSGFEIFEDEGDGEEDDGLVMEPEVIVAEPEVVTTEPEVVTAEPEVVTAEPEEEEGLILEDEEEEVFPAVIAVEPEEEQEPEEEGLILEEAEETEPEDAGLVWEEVEETEPEEEDLPWDEPEEEFEEEGEDLLLEETEGEEEEDMPVDEEPVWVDAKIAWDGTLGGIFPVYVAANDLTPAEGTLVLKEDGTNVAEIDLSVQDNWTASPMDYETMEKLGWSEGTVITVITGTDAGLGMMSEMEAALDLTAAAPDGGRFYTEAEAEVFTPGYGAMVRLKKSQDLLSDNEITVSLYTDLEDSYAEILNNDMFIAEVSAEEVIFGEEDSFTVSFLEEGVASVTVNWYDMDGSAAGTTSFSLPIQAEH